MMPLHRRAVLTSLTAAAGGLLAPAAIDALATAAAARNLAPAFYRFKVGGFELTAIYDGVWHRRIDERFISNAPFAEVQKALTDAFMPADTLSIPFTPLVVDSGSKLVLIDTGSGGQIAPTAGSLGANFAAANIDPKDIDVIVISNFHPLAVTTRKRLLDRAAAERILVTGYHFPFPACGHIAKTASGYEFVPLLWQQEL